MSIDERLSEVLDRELAACMAGQRAYPTVAELLALAFIEQWTAELQ